MTRERGRKKRKWLIPLILLVVLAAGGFGLYQLILSQVFYGEASVEAGTEVEANDLLKPDPGFPASLLGLPEQGKFSGEGEVIDVHRPGEYRPEVELGILKKTVTVTVKDTIPPAGEVHEVTGRLGENVTADDFFTSVTDETAVTANFTKTPDINTRGIQEVGLTLTDLGNNITSYSSTFIIPKVKSSLTVEAGDTLPDIESFLETDLSPEDVESAHFITPRSSLSTMVPGDYPLELSVGKEEYETLLVVEDTTAPIGTPKDVEAYTTSILSPMDFVETVQDVTEVEAEFVSPPRMEQEGQQRVSVRLKDAAGNEGLVEAGLTLRKDTEAPVITGVKDLVFFIGDPVAFKEGVSCTDNCDADIELEVDRSGADLEKEGEYTIVYSARDRAGNSTEKKASVKVMIQLYHQDELDAEADKILAEILKEGMTDYEKAKAIFTWIKGHIFYRETSQKDNPLQAIYEGIVGRSGDCFVFAMSSKELLTRAGIKNTDIMKIPRSHYHFWNLVDVGTGWLHFDTTPRASDHPNIFLWTDAELMEYSGRHYGSHNYDRSLYPEVNGTKAGG